MQTSTTGSFEPEKLTEIDMEQAKESCRRLVALLTEQDDAPFQVSKKGTKSKGVVVPESAIHVLVNTLSELGKGHRVQVVPMKEELTTQEAADFLKVSRPYLVRLLDEKKIPSRKVGTHRRVLYEDLQKYKEQDTEERLRVLAELTEQAQKLNMGY